MTLVLMEGRGCGLILHGDLKKRQIYNIIIDIYFKILALSTVALIKKAFPLHFKEFCSTFTESNFNVISSKYSRMSTVCLLLRKFESC